MSKPAWMDTPSPAEASGDVESSDRPSSSGGANLPPHFNKVKIAFFLGNVGFMVFLAAVGALGMGSARSINDTGLIFVGLYLIVFAGLVFFYELAQVLKWERLDNFMKINFGFLYGVNGKGIFILLSGILCFGLSKPKPLNIVCGVMVAAWGPVQILTYMKFPEYFEKERSAYQKLYSELDDRGAEARVYSASYLAMPAVIKERLSKSYRVKELDTKIIKQRMLQEARCIVKCRRAGVPTPSIYLVDLENNRLYLERIAGRTLKDILWTNMDDKDLLLNIAKNVGAAIGKMHDAEVIHGDLTTSNVIVRCTDAAISADVVIIDFGLGTMKPTMEDKAVDLYVLERAFISTHPGSEFIVSALLESYRFTSRKGTPTLQKLEQVRMRGRKRDMTG